MSERGSRKPRSQGAIREPKGKGPGPREAGTKKGLADRFQTELAR